jgi:hypothetical protein
LLQCWTPCIRVGIGKFSGAEELAKVKADFDCLSKKCMIDKIMGDASLMDRYFGEVAKNACTACITKFIDEYSFDTKTKGEFWDFSGYEKYWNGIVTYYTNDILLQNEFGAYRKSKIMCDYNVDTKIVYSVRYENR